MATKVAQSQEEFSQFAKDALNCHNKFRKIHGVPELKLNEKLCKYAQEWADICAKCCILKHRDIRPYGENIFSAYHTDANHTPSAQEVVHAWYDEIKQHNFEEKVQQETLHFTQVVWKASTELGIGIAKNKKSQTYVVANYEPKGNSIGQFVENVPKPKSC